MGTLDLFRLDGKRALVTGASDPPDEEEPLIPTITDAASSGASDGASDAGGDR